MYMEEKIYFKPGELVTLRQHIPNKPTMMVVRKVKTLLKQRSEDSNLRGFLCRWFDKNQSLQEAIFNTKDLIKIYE